MRIITQAARHKLPAVYFERFFVTTGGLISYGVDLIDPHWRATSYVDRILSGAPAFPAGSVYFSRLAAASMRLRSLYFFTSISLLTKPRSFIIATFFCNASRFGIMSGA